MSPPSRGAWIEMEKKKETALYKLSRPPRGGRGLKCVTVGIQVPVLMSPPSRGAWIEIRLTGQGAGRNWGSPPSRGAWIEIGAVHGRCHYHL